MQIKNYGDHITSYENLDSIKESGLIPMIGERSKSMEEKRTGVYFCPVLILTPLWIRALYNKDDIYKLKLLRFSLDNINYGVRYVDMMELVTYEQIDPDIIQVLKNDFPLDEIILHRNNLEWENIRTLKK